MENNSMALDMDIEVETRQQQPNQHQHQHQRQVCNEGVAGMLNTARQLVAQGNPSLALQAVVMAVKSGGGDDAVIQTLNRARELYRNKLLSNAAAEQLASLFAECAIAEAHPSKYQPPIYITPAAVAPDVNESSILAKSGRMQIMLDAFSDGSSFICLQCGGLVGKNRKDEHLAYWCC